MTNNPAHSPPAISTSLSDLSTAFASRDNAVEAADPTMASLAKSNPPGLGSSSGRTLRSAHSSASARPVTPYQRNKLARSTADTDVQDESLGDSSSRRKSTRRDNASPSATSRLQSQPNNLANMEVEGSSAFELEASERPTSPSASFQDNEPFSAPSGNPIFISLTSAIRSLTDKPSSEFHEDVFLAISSFAQSIFDQLATSTSNAELIHDSANIDQLKTSLSSAAEDFIRKLKLGCSSPGLGDSSHAPPSDPLNALLEEVRALKFTQVS